MAEATLRGGLDLQSKFSRYNLTHAAYLVVKAWMGSSESSLVDLPTDDFVSLVCAGRTELYEEIIRRFQGDVLRVVSVMPYDRGAAEDLVQQVFVSAYLNLSDYQTGRDFGGWIRTIARNAVRQELRRASRYDRRLKVYGELLAARLHDDNAEEHNRIFATRLESLGIPNW